MSISNNLQKQKLLVEIKEKLILLDQQKNWFLVLSPWLRTELTYSSNSLEGNTLSLIETGIVINDNQSIAGKNMREIYEARNHAKAWDFAQINLITKNTDKLTETELLNLHRLILQNIDDLNAGKYRNVSVRIAGSNNIFPNPLKVPDLIIDVFDWLRNATIQDVEKLIETAILVHLKIVKIHPFTDGNARTARLFMNTILMQNSLPPINIQPENRKEYLESLELSTIENNENFMNFILQTFNQNLDIYLQTF